MFAEPDQVSIRSQSSHILGYGDPGPDTRFLRYRGHRRHCDGNSGVTSATIRTARFRNSRE